MTLNANGSFSYTPTAAYTGPDSFTYHANDGSLNSNVVTVSLTVSLTNTAPVAVADTYSTPLNTALTVAAPGVLVNDTDAESNPLTAVLNTTVGHGTLTLNANGSFSYPIPPPIPAPTASPTRPTTGPSIRTRSRSRSRSPPPTPPRSRWPTTNTYCRGLAIHAETTAVLTPHAPT